MADLKTQPNNHDVEAYINSVENDKRREDALLLLDLMKSITGEEAVMWGSSIVGFGNYHYKYESGREGDWFLTGFSPRKASLSVYIMPGFEKYDRLMSKLGKYKTGKSCLYINKIEDVDLELLKQLIAESVAYMRKKYTD